MIRIVHSNGRVEEISGGSIRAAEVLKSYPKHVLKKPCSSSDDCLVPQIVVVPPEAELQRGKIYFLMPAPEKSSKSSLSRSSGNRRKRRENSSSSTGTNLVVSERYLSEILSEKISTQRDRRRGRVGVWRPHLESISETPIDV